MLILITAFFIFATALALLVLRIMRPEFRFTWLTAGGGAFLAGIPVMLWQPQIPLSIPFSWWPSAPLSLAVPTFAADRLAWPYAASLVILAVAVLLTSAVQEDLSDSLVWSACLTVCGLGLLAVTANNPLTLVLVWGAMDITELVIRLRFASDRRLSERAVIAFSIRACGIMLVLMADVLAAAAGKTTDFASAPPEAGLLLLAAAGLRLGILPMPLPYAAGAAMRRDLDTTLSLVAAATRLALVAPPPTTAASPTACFVPLVLLVVAGPSASWVST